MAFSYKYGSEEYSKPFPVASHALCKRADNPRKRKHARYLLDPWSPSLVAIADRSSSESTTGHAGLQAKANRMKRYTTVAVQATALSMLERAP